MSEAISGLLHCVLTCLIQSNLPRPAFAEVGYGAAALATKGLAGPKQAQPAKAGGARRDRTADLVIANDALSQLSYGPFATD
jgi:hypothetical protein